MTVHRKDEARRWFLQARHDLRAAQWNIEGGFHNTACFLAQQAAEKALKSLLYFLGSRRSALLTHSLVEMIDDAAKQVGGLENLLEKGRVLDLHYVPSRYPNGLPGGYPHQFYGRETSIAALKAAEELVGFVSGWYGLAGETEILSSDE